MLRTDDEETQDRENEVEFWQTWRDTGKQTDCLGTVAKVCIVLAIIVQSILHSWA